MSVTRRILIFTSALIFAALLWTYVRLSAPYEADIDLPITLIAPKGLAAASPLPKRLHSRVRGAGWQILLLNFTKNARYQFDLSNRSIPANATVVLHSDEILHAAMAPTDLRFLKVDPDSLVISFEKVVHRRIPIRPEMDITAAHGYLLVGAAKITPTSVEITGAPRIVDSLAYFPTALISAHNVKQDFEKSVTLADTLSNYVSYAAPLHVSVRTDVQPIAERVMPQLVVTVDALPPSYEVFLIPSRVDVTLRGGVDALASLHPSDIRVHIPFEPVTFDTAQTLHPKVEIPAGLELLRVDPPTLRFIVRHDAP